MKQEKAKRKLNKFDCVLIAIIVVLCGTILFTSISYAKYYKEYIVAANNSRIAGMIVDVNKITTDSNIELGEDNESQQYMFTVSNSKDGKVSEVAFTYTVELTVPVDEMPSGLIVTLSATGTGITNQPTSTFVDIEGTNTGLIKFSGEDLSFEAGVANQHTLTLNFEIDDNIQEDIRWQNLSLNVHAEQII